MVLNFVLKVLMTFELTLADTLIQSTELEQLVQDRKLWMHLMEALCTL